MEFNFICIYNIYVHMASLEMDTLQKYMHTVD